MTDPAVPAERGRIAVLSPVPPLPATLGNRKRIWSVCEGLKSRGFDVDLILYALDDEWRLGYPRAAGEQMRRECHDLHMVAPSVRYHVAAQRGDHAIDEWWDPALETFLKWYFAAVRPDGFLVNYPFLSRALEFAPETCLKILDMHDRFSGRRQMLASLGVKPEFFYTTPDQEAIALGRADVALAITENERQAFEELTDKPVLTLPFVEPARSLSRSAAGDGYLRIGLFGGANSVNRVNTYRFLDAALPVFVDHMAPVKVVLAGGMCRDLERFSQSPYVEVLGEVDQADEFYRAVDIVVAPTEKSTGQAIKVGEALALGAPVIAHAHAFGGYIATHPLHRLASAAQIARACVDLAFEPGKIGALAAASSASQSAQEQRVAAVLDELAARVRAARRSLFVVDSEQFRSSPGHAMHILTMAGFCAVDRRVTVLLRGEIVGPVAERLCRETQKFAVLRHEGPRSSLTERFDIGEADLDGELASAEPDLDLWCYDPAALPVLAAGGRQVTAVHGFSGGLTFAEIPTADGGSGAYVATGRVSATPGGPGFLLQGGRPLPIRAYSKSSARPFLSPQAGEGSPIAAVFAGTEVTPLLLTVLSAIRALGLPTAVIAWGDLDLAALRRELRLQPRADPGFHFMPLADAPLLQWRHCTHFFDVAQTRPEHVPILELLRFIALRRERSDLVWRGPPGAEAPIAEVIADLFDYVHARNRWACDPRFSARTIDDGLGILGRLRSRAA
jgi:glycosyltransferase involved in cell wall biosynthesis